MRTLVWEGPTISRGRTAIAAGRRRQRNNHHRPRRQFNPWNFVRDLAALCNADKDDTSGRVRKSKYVLYQLFFVCVAFTVGFPFKIEILILCSPVLHKLSHIRFRELCHEFSI
jgi:hypothetical protein